MIPTAPKPSASHLTSPRDRECGGFTPPLRCQPDHECHRTLRSNPGRTAFARLCAIFTNSE